MKHLVILTALAFVASLTFAGIVDTQDPPDIRLTAGAASPAGIVDLNDYFSTNNAGAASFAGDNVASDGLVSVPGAADPGTTDFSATITVGADSGTVNYTRKVSSFLLEGAPEADDSLILVDQAAGTNVFLNCLQAGVAVQSAEALTGGPAGGGTGGSGTPGDGTPGGGSAVWSITFGEVVSGFSTTGQKTRSSSVIASGVDSLSNGGLTASIDADGNYTLEADASFAGPVVVTFIKSDGDDMDAASVVASAAIVGDNGAGTNDLNDPNLAVTIGDGAGGGLPTGASVQVGAALGASPAGYTDGTGISVSAPAGQTVQVFLPTVAVDGPVTVSVSTWATQGDFADTTTTSLAVLDGEVFTLGYQDLVFMNAGGLELGQGVPRRLSVTYDAPSGSVGPVLQVIGPGTVEFDNLEICRATAPDTFALGNGGQDLYGWADFSIPVAGDFSGGLTGVDVNGIAASGSYSASGAATVVSANGFDTAGTAGSIALAGNDSVLTNITVSSEHAGTSAVRVCCNAQVATSTGSGASYNFLALVISALPSVTTDVNSIASFGTFASAAKLAGSGAWTSVEATGQIQSAELAPEIGGVFLITLQNAYAGQDAGAGAVINVDDIAVYSVQDEPEFFDATLAGL